MGNIVLLDDLTINKIAAGEVIERPANVVKELVENSIDAGASQITIEVKNGGKSLIKVVDNGKGISPDDLEISIESHATSKIRKIEDIENTYTMGFRGEALASISAVSNFTIISKVKDSIVGYKMTSSSGNILNIEEVASKTGTTMIVENLFFNTPVRYKFLKNDGTESRYIKEWVQKVALVNLDISFKLVIDKKEVFSSKGNGKIEDLIYVIYGKKIKENIINVDYNFDKYKMTGVIGNTMIAEETRKNQIIYLNKRNIKNPIIMNAVDQAFKGATGIGKHGFCIINIEMPANFYDVNVHPNKMEVRFKDEDEIYKFVYHGIKESMLNAEFLGNDDKTDKKEYVENELKFLGHEKEAKDIKPEENNIIRETKRKIEYKYLGISFKTYIVIQIDNDVYFIDQHAAHERILYEQIKNNYKANISHNTQMTLIPEVYELTHKEVEFIRENMELFTNIGFDLEFFGENSVKVNGIPDIEYRGKTKNIFFDILDEMLSTNRTIFKDIEERFIATVACKAAVKAGMDLTREEVDYLIQNLLVLNNPYTCPHGRPTAIKFNKEEMGAIGDVSV